MGKNKSHKARKNKNILSNPCGCYFCCGNPDKEHAIRKLKLVKNPPKNWIEEE